MKSRGKIQMRLGFFLAIGIVAFFFFSSLFLKNLTAAKSVSVANVITGTGQVSKESPPQFFYWNKGGAPSRISAGAFVVGDLETGEVILSKNVKQKLPIASVSKLMTALVASKMDQAERATVSKRAVATYGGNGNFKANQKVKIGDLIYPLLLESSNDAAEVLAEHEGREIFIDQMNAEAIRLGLSQTEFRDPSGLSYQNQSTPLDLFKLAQFLSKEKPDILKITTQVSHSDDSHGWSSNNQFLREIGYFGGKSGYTDPARQTVISLFQLPLGREGNRPIAIALLQSNDRYRDVQNILSYLKKNIYYGTEADANIAWVKQKDGIPEAKDPDYITFSFLGDMMFDRGVESSVRENFAGDYSDLFQNLAILKEADIVFANLEGPASDKGEDLRNLYSFRMDPAVVPALRGAGVDIVSLANNHMGDWGVSALVDTMDRLKENEILYTGSGFTKSQVEEPTIIEKYGMKIGFLGFSDVGPNWMRAKEEMPGVLIAGDTSYEEVIKKASEKVDFLVISMHWGDEYKNTHNPRQEDLAHKAIDSGAKLVIGHHPHVAQDTEVYKDGFIAYSLGNFIFDQGFSAETMKGMLLNLRLGRDGSIAVAKNTIQLNRVFQPEKVIKAKEEKLKFDVPGQISN